MRTKKEITNKHLDVDDVVREISNADDALWQVYEEFNYIASEIDAAIDSLKKDLEHEEDEEIIDFYEQILEDLNYALESVESTRDDIDCATGCDAGDYLLNI